MRLNNNQSFFFLEIQKNHPEKDKQSSFTPNTADVNCSSKGKETSVSGEIDLTASPDCYDIPRYLANGVGINDHDIATLDADAMMNDNIVTVLLRYIMQIKVVTNSFITAILL